MSKCPHCGAWAPCNDQSGRIAAYMESKGREKEWRQAIGKKRSTREPEQSGHSGSPVASEAREVAGHPGAAQGRLARLARQSTQ